MEIDGVGNQAEGDNIIRRSRAELGQAPEMLAASQKSKAPVTT